MLEVEGGDRDVIGYARDGDDAVIALMRIRGGKLLARDHQFVENVEEETGRRRARDLSRRPVSSARGARAGAAASVRRLRSRASSRSRSSARRSTCRSAGRVATSSILAQQNARHLLEEARLTGDEPTEERAGDPVYELQRQLGLQKVPRSFVCFDISHAQGTDTVASCVWFQNGRPYRAEYRKFKVKTVEGIDDFASMNEVVGRYFQRRLDDERPLPDLVLIDGGKGQLNAAADALKALGSEAMPLVSLAKREEEIFLLGRSEPLRLPRRSPALRMLQQARDEAHRFAITFQRKRRSVRTITSELLRIPGIGDNKRRLLLSTFGSVQAIRDATPEQIAAVPGFSLKSARAHPRGVARERRAGARPARRPLQTRRAPPRRSARPLTHDPTSS